MKRLGMVILILLILSIAGTMIFFSFEENQKWFVRYLDSFSNKGKQVVENAYIPGDGISYINGRYLVWNGEELSVSDESGKILWERTFLMDDPKLDIRDNLIGIYDRISGEAMVFSFNGEILAQIEEESPIFSFKPSKNGHIVHIKEEARQVLKIYERNGEHRENIIFTKGYPIDYILEEESILVTVLDFQNKGINTKVLRYNEDGDQELYSIDDRIIIKVASMTKGNLIVADTGIYMQQNEDLVWGRDFPMLKDVLLDGNEIYVIYGDNLRILDDKGSTLRQETFGMDYNNLHNHGKYIILAGDKDILVLLHREPVASYSFNATIVDIQSQFNDLVITTENGVNIMRIEDKENETEEEKQ
ncbi:DUF5711 family protein [Gudongella sp. DL1XJH-153]|uniref:DUF5711 family protein n=1 Tax=Gudongella sp. DL1XJH-153 TaxID=3409804 RepID=UPI003BB74D9C